MKLGIEGKVALVTGGARGLGKACAIALAEEGCRVVVTARRRASAEANAASFKDMGVRVVASDVTDAAQVDALFETIRRDEGGVDILVYNTGGPPGSTFDAATEKEHMLAYRMLILGYTWCVKQALADMTPRGWGRIVSLGSFVVKESRHDLPPHALHSINRAGQMGLSKTISNEVGKHGVTVNTIATGPFDNYPDSDAAQRFRARAEREGLTDEELRAERAASVPMGRVGRPEEIGALCAFLASDSAGFITGQTLVIDGGKSQAIL